MRILLVDDDPDLRAQVERVLSGERYLVEMAGDGDEALEKIFAEPYDVIILDIMLPGTDGFGVLKELREEKIDTPVIMLTARGDVEDRVQGLDLGADDYLAKPFSMAELLARIRALLRRGGNTAHPVLQVRNIRLDPKSREVTRDGALIDLTPKEFLLLEFLLYNRNRAVSRFTMAEHVWGDAFDPFIMSNNIDVHIKNLRRKIGDDGNEIVRSVRGVGYMIKDGEE
ncbi:MAG: response regulator transcription factor [Desulfobulbaceae bacterium]